MIPQEIVLEEMIAREKVTGVKVPLLPVLKIYNNTPQHYRVEAVKDYIWFDETPNYNGVDYK